MILITCKSDVHPATLITVDRYTPPEGDSDPRSCATLGTAEKHVASIFAKLGPPACQTDNRRVLAVLRYLGA